MTTFRSFVRSVVLENFPWLARLGLTERGDLAVKSASGKLELAGGDQAVARVTDGCTRLAFYPGVPTTTPPSLWYSNSVSPPYVWAPVSVCLVTGPLPADAGTQVTILSGSSKVRAG